MEKVAVLLSMYNGEKYISEQLDSVLKQEDVEVCVYIRDDGSSDNSISIVDEYMKNNSNVILINGKNVGVANSFMNLLYSVPDEYAYYSFCDQDDIWEKRKLISAIKFLTERKSWLYTSNQELVDKDNNSLGMRYAENESINLKPLAILQNNMLAGCTMVFSNEFYRILSKEENRPSRELLNNRIHDVWVAMVASIFDNIVYDKRSFMRYRQHDSNVFGAYSFGLKYSIMLKWKKIINPNERNGRSKLAQEIVRIFPDVSKNNELLTVCANPKKIINKLVLIKNRKIFLRYTKESSIGFIFKVVFNLF